MTSPRTLFFWLVKVKVANVADCIRGIHAVAKSILRVPILSCTSVRRQHTVSDGLSVYSPGQSKKKNASPIMSAMA